jgi:hypothetical protein
MSGCLTFGATNDPEIQYLALHARNFVGCLGVVLLR